MKETKKTEIDLAKENCYTQMAFIIKEDLLKILGMAWALLA